MKVRITPKAEEDLLDTVEFLLDRSVASANRLIDDFDATLERLALFPEIGRPRGESRWILLSESWVLQYRVVEGDVVVTGIQAASVAH